MDDMNDFERQVAGEVIRAAAPARPVDAAAVFAAIPTATRSPKWRFQTMFSATRFVVAGAIVALFGGFLLTGVLTRQPSDEVAPAAASASAAPAIPSPTDDAIGIPPYLVTEEVEPGVLKVMTHEFVGTDQGADLAGRAFVGLALAADGTPWVLEAQTGYGDAGRFSLFQLGTEERHELADQDNVTADLSGVRSDLEFAEDGTIWARHLGDRSVLHSFDGEAWSETVSAGDAIGGFALGSDGVPLVGHEVVSGAPHESVHRLVDGTWQSLPPVDEQTLSQLAHPWEFDGRTPWMGTATVSPEGEAWIPAPGGLLRHAAGGWSFHEPIPLDEAEDTVLVAGRVAVGADGTLWWFANEGRTEVPKLSIARHLARFDGSTWTVYSSEGRPFDLEGGGGIPALDPWAGLSVDADGRLWLYGAQDRDWVATEDQDLCPGLLSFDGREWRRYLRGACVNDVAMGTDGSVWAASYGTWTNRDDRDLAGIFVIRPEPMPAADDEATITGLLPDADLTATAQADSTEGVIPGSELLPGVDLITEEVEPGVHRVLNDGVRDLARPLADYDYSWNGVQISAGRDGSVWLHSSASRWHGRPVENPPDHVLPFKLGVPVDPRIDDETNDPDGVEHDAPLDYRDPVVTEEGTLYVGADGVWSFADRPDEDAWQQQLGGAGWDYAIADDGSVWSIAGVFDMTVLGRKSDGSPWDAVEVPWRFENEPSLLSVSRSGDVWLRSEAWFARYDGADWQRWRSPIGDQGPAVLGLDGTLWTVAAECYACRSLARFDGVEWTVYEEADGVPAMGGFEMPIVLEASPDGSVWLNSVPKDPRDAGDATASPDDATEPQACGGVHRFDGSTWSRYLDGICVYDLDVAPDGKAWLRGGTFDLAAEEFGSVSGPVEVYAITPEAVDSTA